MTRFSLLHKRGQLTTCFGRLHYQDQLMMDSYSSPGFSYFIEVPNVLSPLYGCCIEIYCNVS